MIILCVNCCLWCFVCLVFFSRSVSSDVSYICKISSQSGGWWHVFRPNSAMG